MTGKSKRLRKPETPPRPKVICPGCWKEIKDWTTIAHYIVFECECMPGKTIYQTQANST